MAIKNLQFVVTVAVNVPDDWECPTFGTDHIESVLGGAIYNDRLIQARNLDVEEITSVSATFETITD